MNGAESIRSVVARFFNVAESELTEAFAFPPERLQGSVGRSTLHAALKRIAGVETERQLIDVEAELKDRYGEPPLPVRQLLRYAALRLQAVQAGHGRFDAIFIAGDEHEREHNLSKAQRLLAWIIHEVAAGRSAALWSRCCAMPQP